MLETVTGYHIEFDSIPVQSNFPTEIKFQEEERKIVDTEIAELVHKGAIAESFFLFPNLMGNSDQ